jgi:ATP-dependent helicase/nuclease subunit A
MAGRRTNENQLDLGFQEKAEASAGSEKMPLDQPARERIRTDIDTSMMVLAGAGAGKTYELVERMVALLADDRGDEPVKIRNIAAITFTRKAAGELRTRFYGRLLNGADERDGAAGDRLNEAAANIDQCFIGTIHSFCSRLLRERPLEAGLPFDFRELDERDEPRARRQAWTRFTNERLRAGDKRLERLLEIGFNAEDLYSFFVRRNEFPELKLKPTDASEPDLSRAVALTAELGQTTLTGLNPAGLEKPGKWASTVQRALRYSEKKSLSTNADRAAFLLMFDSKSILNGGVQVTKYHDRDWARELRDDLVPRLKAEVIDPAIRSWKQYVYSLMADLIDEASSFYAESRRAAGVVTFSDLLVMTARVLRDHPEIRAYFQKRYRRILVDEFQDTDPVQAEILFYLTGSDTRERDWQRLAPVPGSLFVVGDEKQSIYRFRRADVETFRFVEARIKETGGEVVSLNTSFRSLGNLCSWLNGTFEQVFGQEDPAFQAQHGELLPFRPAGRDGPCVRQLVLQDDLGKRVEKVKWEASRIADLIAAVRKGETEFNGSEDDSILSKRPSYGSFMILARVRPLLEIYAQALEARGIPFDLVGGDLGKSEELETVTLMLEALADPSDPVPLIGYLRGMLVGLADDQLLSVRKALGRFDFNQEELGALAELDGNLVVQLETAYERLRRARQLLQTLPPAAAVEQVIDETGLIPWASASSDFMGSSRAGNLVRLLANVRRWERQGLHWVDIAAEMRALIEETEYEIPGLTLEAGKEDAVRIMNLHQAKGLEADVVFLVDPSWRGYDGPPEFHVKRLGDEPYLSMAAHERLRWGHKTKAEPEGWFDDEEIERRHLQAEDTRLRYVAATRARNMLVVSVDPDNKKGPWKALEPYLGEVPSLPSYPPAEAPALEEGVTTYAEERAARSERWDLVGRPSWAIETVSLEGEDHTVFLSGEQRGADYGSVIHQLFEDLIEDRIKDVDEYLDTTTTLDGEAKAAALAAAQGFQDSDLWKAIARADQVYTEAAFGRIVSAEPERIARGRIDLIFKSPDGWMIVDFKTDAVGNDEEALRIADFYKSQVVAYAEHWFGVTGEPVVEKGLWLTALNRYVPID